MYLYTVIREEEPSLLVNGFLGLAERQGSCSFGCKKSFNLFPFQGKEKRHLIITDCTSYNRVEQLESQKLERLTDNRTLALVKGAQVSFISVLKQHYACSLLCVDELMINTPEIATIMDAGKRYISPELQRYANRNVSSIPGLTRAERAVLECLRKGLWGADAAKRLCRSEKTISSHKRQIMNKLGAHDDVSLRQKLSMWDSGT